MVDLRVFTVPGMKGAPFGISKISSRASRLLGGSGSLQSMSQEGLPAVQSSPYPGLGDLGAGANCSRSELADALSEVHPNARTKMKID